MRWDRRDIATALGAVGVVWLFWLPLLHPGRTTVSSDLTNLLWMQRLHLWRGLSEGVIPLWNPHVWGGAPFLASLQPAVFDPTTWLGFLRGGDPTALLLAFDIQRAAILGLLALSVFALARAGLGIGRLGSAFAAVLVGCCEHLWGHIDHVILLSALVWTPLMMMAGLRIARGGGGRPALLIAVCFALQIFAGHPQHAAFALMALALTVAVTLALDGAALRQWGQAAVMIAAGLALGVALSAAQLLPALELSRLSARQFETDSALFSMRPVEFARLLLPAREFSENPAHRGETGLFIGRLAVALALLGLGAALRRWRESRGLIAVAGLGLFAAIWSLGSNGPLFGPLVAAIPPLQGFRVPPRMLFHLDLALALLAGFGLSVIARRLATRRGAALAVGGLALVVGWTELRLASSGALFRRPVPIAALALESPLAEPIVSQRVTGRLWRLEIMDGDHFLDPRAEALLSRAQRLQPNLNVLWQIEETEGYVEGLLPTARWRDLLFHLNRNLRQARPEAATLALLGVEWVIAETWIAPIEHPALQPVAELTRGEQRLTLHRNLLALPHVLPLETLTRLAPPEALDGAWSRGEAEAPARGGVAAPVLRPNAEWPDADTLPPLPWSRPTVNEIRILNPEAFTGEAALVQATYPGWRVHSPRSRPTALRVENAVWSSWRMEGEPEVTLRFEPATHRVGLFVSLAGALILTLTLAAGSGAGTRSRRESPPPG